MKSPKMGALWPQPYKFCGLFPLKFGVIAYIVFFWVLNILNLYFAWTAYITTIQPNDTDVSAETNVQYGVVLSSHLLVIWIISVTILHSFQFFAVGFLIYGYWKPNPFFVKIYLYYSVATWILQVFISYILIFMSNYLVRLIMISLVLIHLYLLLILRTIHLQMTGRSQIITTVAIDDPTSTTAETNNIETVDRGQAVNSPDSHRNIGNQRQSSINETFEDETSNSNPLTTTTIPVRGVENVVTRLHAKEISIDSPKQLHIEDETVIYIVDRFELSEQDRRTSINSIRISVHAEITNRDVEEINGNNETGKEVPPVIYDENQLNVGSSSVLEDR